MHGVFLAFGPNIKNGYLNSFENIHIPFITKILGLKPNKDIDGSVQVLGDFVK